MTTQELRAAAAVMTEYARLVEEKGHECANAMLQFRLRNPSEACPQWTPTPLPCVPSWDLVLYTYRIKPEPREWWLNDCWVGYGNREIAKEMSRRPDFEPVKVREVLE